MNVIGWMNEILSKLSGDDIELEFKKGRYYFPDASYIVTKKYPNGLMRIKGNPPSLVRIGLAYLIAHELTHHEHNKIFGNVGDDGDMVFQIMERKMLNKVWEICLEEQEHNEDVS